MGRPDFVDDDEGEQEKQERVEKCSCGGEFEPDAFCGASLCNACGRHKGLARCYCGWTSSGNDDGYRELQEMGENIEPEYEDEW